MHGSLLPLQFHGDHFRLPAMENAGHTRCGHSRETRGGFCPWGNTCRGMLPAPLGRGSHWGRHAWGLLGSEQEHGSHPQGQAGSDAAVAPLVRDPVPVPKPGCALRAAGLRKGRGPGQAPSPSPPGLEPGQSPPRLGWEKPLNQGHLPGDWRLSEPHEPLSCQGRDARHPGSEAPATLGQRSSAGVLPAPVPATAPGQVGDQPSACQRACQEQTFPRLQTACICRHWRVLPATLPCPSSRLAPRVLRTPLSLALHAPLQPRAGAMGQKPPTSSLWGPSAGLLPTPNRLVLPDWRGHSSRLTGRTGIGLNN